MPDAPDNYQFLLDSPRDVLGDLGEAVARLGSLVRYQRTGDVAWETNWDRGLGDSDFNAFGTGADYYIGAGVGMYGGYYLHLIGGSDSFRTASFTKTVYALETSKLGFMLEWALFSIVENVEMQIIHYDGSFVYEPYLRFDYANQVIQVRDQAGTYQDVGVWSPSFDTRGVAHHTKYTMDIPNQKYGRLFFDNQTIDISTYQMAKTASTFKPTTFVDFIVKSRAGQNDQAGVTMAVVTVGEV